MTPAPMPRAEPESKVSMDTLIMKFGGSTVGTTSALTQVLSIILEEHERWKRLLVVVSALEGVTDALIEAARLAQLGNRRGYRRIAATLRTRHMALAENLPLGATERAVLQADIDRLLFDMLDTCQALADRRLNEDYEHPEHYEAIVGVGERLSARIVAALLRQCDGQYPSDPRTQHRASPAHARPANYPGHHRLHRLDCGWASDDAGPRRQRLHRLSAGCLYQREGSMGLDRRRWHDDDRPARGS